MKPYLPTLVICVILFIAVFLPWRTFSDLGFSENGLRAGGILTFIMSILGVGISFVTVPKIRALGTIFIGILAIVGVAVFWARIEGLTAGYGLIIALIASLGLIAVGYLEYRKLGQPAQPSQPPPASPPAPPAPPQ
jgi:hypothetical protein